MTPLEEIAAQILARNPLEARVLMHAYLRLGVPLATESAPTTRDQQVRAVAAGLAELLASRTAQVAPAWTREIGKLPTPVYLVEAALKSVKLRERVERESPEPLRKRNVFAPSSYLEII